jgi:hypothetical protein
MSSASPDLEAYDALPPLIRREVAASPWPLPCPDLARELARRGANATLRRLRKLEQDFAEDHARGTAEACER